MLLATRLAPTVRLLGLLAVAATLTVGCASDDEDAMGDMGDDMGDAMGDDMGDGMDDGMDGMDGMAMDDRADIMVAAEAMVESLPPEPLGWVGYRVAHREGARARAWGPAFVFADDEPHTLELDGAEVVLEPGEAAFVEDGVEHTPIEGDHWAFLLTDPDADPPPGLDDATRKMTSGPLEGLPDESAQVRFLLVDLPPEDGQTAVHSHPGPEYIYVAQGQIEYETGLTETTELTVGDDAPLPGGTAVQKRNVHSETARFWSWFVVDPDEPFSSDATFDGS